MKYILLPCLLIISCAGFCQTTTFYFNNQMNIVSQQDAAFKGTGEPDNGLYKLTCYNIQNKSLVFMAHFTDSSFSVFEGLFRSYFANGNRETEGVYEQGKENGNWKKWNLQGNIVDSIFYDNGKIIRQTSFNYSPGNHLESIETADMQSGKFYKSVYDDAGKLIATDTTGASTHEDEDKVFTKVEIEASFPGGDGAWQKYIDEKMAEHSDDLDKGETCTIAFIVNKDGSVREPKAVNGNGSALAKVVANALMKGPKWMPAQQNGRYVTAYKILHVKYTGSN
ncbi:MAG: hypothetical protein ACRDE5_07615 [Ginsengibacter sp.]